jgi:ABC-type dipeptide/oligopeptide/nickel transport system ATPase component
MQEVRGAKISLIFQEPIIALNPTMQVGEQISEALTVHHKVSRTVAQARVIELLEAVRIPNAIDRAKDYPHQLSGGMRQRVMIAIALACRPLLLIADEPTTALDMTIQAEVLDLLRELRATYNLSLLLITHDFGVIAEMADYVAVMYQGQIVEQGSVRKILRQPLHAYTRSLLEAVPGHS